MQSASSVYETCNAINAACKDKGGVYKDYSCKTVSWDDVQRGTVCGTLSCWGGNITDTRLWEKSGTLLYTCRSDNWNEKLGKVDADSVAVVVGNHSQPSRLGEKVALQAVALTDFLKNAGHYVSYTGVKSGWNLYHDQLDREVSIRFQTTFLPVEDSDFASLEFCTEAYNYNTQSDNDPRNAVMLCTSQGIAFQQDGAGAKKLFHHSVDHNGTVHQHWLEAERSQHKVGGAQMETEEEAMSAVARGKATASVIGIEAMGTRFNVLMTVQIPLQQKPGLGRIHKINTGKHGAAKYIVMEGASSYGGNRCAVREPSRANSGKANAARVSRGSEVGQWKGVINTKPKRDPRQHITLTVVIYNTVAGGVPSAQDVQDAIDDMEQLYAACAWNGALAKKEADFMKSELTASETIDITKKIKEQPYSAPQCGLVENGSAFPRTSAK